MFRHAWNWLQFLAVTAASAAATAFVLTSVSAFAADISAEGICGSSHRQKMAAAATACEMAEARRLLYHS